MPVASLLPFTATPNRKSASPTSFRLTEKFILLLVFSGFITLCFGAIFFLPDSSKLLSGVFFRSSSVEAETRTGTVSDTSTGTGKDEKILYFSQYPPFHSVFQSALPVVSTPPAVPVSRYFRQCSPLFSLHCFCFS
uniref:Uncharacterized protein n=1 Tax=Sinocyclocheilus grahami TaxID=75366 RepID=A0A672KC01_SINGR